MAEYTDLSKEELIVLCQHLRGQLSQERAKPSAQTTSKASTNKRKAEKTFDFSRFHERHIALKFAYIGTNYHGFASQDTSEETIEAYLFAALQKVCLIQDRSSCNYSRCGRTDKGVSALGQVISLNVRSNLSSGPGIVQKESAFLHQLAQHSDPVDSAKKTELDFVTLLNRVLPDDIRVLAWAPVGLEFDARFSCLYRTYKYYFLRERLDVAAMHGAAQKLVGEHDFRNFCKLDISGDVTSFRRRIMAFEISLPGDASALGDAVAGLEEATMCEMTITGHAFLWHQVRCMAAVLFLVGQGLEEPSIIDDLLRVGSTPGKPQYDMASDLPLVLYECGFESIHWLYQPHTQERVSADLFEKMRSFSLQARVTQGMLEYLGKVLFPVPVDSKKSVVPSDERSDTVGDYIPWSKYKHKFPSTSRSTYRPLLSRICSG